MAVREDVAVSYHAAILYKEDVATLAPGGWLTDNVLCFWCEVLTHDTFSTAQDRVLFMHPATAFMALFEDGEELEAALSALCLRDRQLVCMPVNDNPFADAVAGGSHWSLLVFRRAPPSEGAGGVAPKLPAGFSHWDSAPGCGNAAVASRLAAAMAPVLGAATATVTRVPVPHQANGSDCGVFAMHFAELVARYYVSHTDSSGSDGEGAGWEVSDGEGQAHATAARARMASLAQGMAAARLADKAKAHDAAST